MAVSAALSAEDVIMISLSYDEIAAGATLVIATVLCLFSTYHASKHNYCNESFFGTVVGFAGMVTGILFYAFATTDPFRLLVMTEVFAIMGGVIHTLIQLILWGVRSVRNWKSRRRRRRWY